MSDTPVVASAEEPSTPPPAAIGLPVDRVPGDWADVYEPELVDEPRDVPSHLSPVPFIGAIAFGGVVMQAEQRTLAQGEAVVIGERGTPRPKAMQIVLYSATTAATFGGLHVLADGAETSNAPGLPLPLGGATPVAPIVLPLRRVTVKNIGSATAFVLGWAIIGYPDLG